MKVSELPLSKSAEGRLRVISAAIMAPVVLGMVYLGGAAYAALIAVMVTVALYEWLRIVDPEATFGERLGLYVALVVALIFAALNLQGFGLIVLALAGAALYSHRSNVAPSTAPLYAFGLPYLAGSGIALIYLRERPSFGLAETTYLLAIVWGMDIGAYFTGRRVGGPKLAPTISPNKTWSGFFGGMALALLLASLVLMSTGARSLPVGLIVAAGLAAVAQMGDLFKSFFKRRAGVKDSGTLIPGHGGVLDRIDGLVFAATALALLHAFFGVILIW